MSKTKYIKVSVSERLPDLAGNYNTDLGLESFSKAMNMFIDDDGEEIYPEYWFHQVPDYEEEMKEMLEKIISIAALGEKVPDYMVHEGEDLLTKLKKES